MNELRKPSSVSLTTTNYDYIKNRWIIQWRIRLQQLYPKCMKRYHLVFQVEKGQSDSAGNVSD